MPLHVWSVLCTRGILDSYTNNVSLIEVVESLKVTPSRAWREEQTVAVPTAMALVSLWLRSDPEAPEHFETRVVIVMPDGTEAPGNAMAGDLLGHSRLRTFMKVDHLPIRSSGLYWLVIEHRSVEKDVWTRAARVPLQVELELPRSKPAQKEKAVGKPAGKSTADKARR